VTILPLLVDTLTGYPDDATTSLHERWILRIAQANAHRYKLRAALGTLANELRPCRVSLNGEGLTRDAWSYDRATSVFSTTFEGRASQSTTIEAAGPRVDLCASCAHSSTLAGFRGRD
jgi:hypothetical protein